MVCKKAVWQERAFLIIFAAFTFLCWCPVFYGQYGPVEQITGMPSWAALALMFGAILFVIEWFFLFFSNLAINDESLPDIIAAIQKIDRNGKKLASKEGK